MRRIRIGKAGEFAFLLQTPYRYSRKRKKALKSKCSDKVLELLIKQALRHDN
jgi:hypothetical protein